MRTETAGGHLERYSAKFFGGACSLAMQEDELDEKKNKEAAGKRIFLSRK